MRDITVNLSKFSHIAKPLTDLLVGCKVKGNAARSPNWTWGPEQQHSFEMLRDKLTSPPILAYPNYKDQFILHTDACSNGLGAVLCQNQEGKTKVIAFASRGLNKSEKNYPAHKLEFLALKWAITEKCNDYLYGQTFEVLTDNNPLTYVLTTDKLDATGHRWQSALTAFNFKIKYRPGNCNMDADYLSRLPVTLNEISHQVMKAINNSTNSVPWIESLSMSAHVLDDEEEEINGHRDWRKIQREDSVIGVIIRQLSGYTPNSNKLILNPSTRPYARLFKQLQLKRGVLYRRTTVDDEEVYQLVLPEKYQKQVLKGLHDDMGHLGRDRTIDLVSHRFFWPHMADDVDKWIKKCSRCILRKTPVQVRAPLVSIRTSHPLELLCMDYLTLEKSKGGYEHLLVIVDHFTKYAIAVPTRNQTAKTTADALFNNVFIHYGFAKRLHSDKGMSFVGSVIKELCELTGMERSTTTPYHPMGNGITERLNHTLLNLMGALNPNKKRLEVSHRSFNTCLQWNHTLLNLMGTLNPNKKKDWKSHIGPLTHAYNGTRHDSTGMTPFFLMFGREPRLAIDVALNIPEMPGQQSYTKYVKDLKTRLRDAYEQAAKHTQKASLQQKT